MQILNKIIIVCIKSCLTLGIWIVVNLVMFLHIKYLCQPQLTIRIFVPHNTLILVQYKMLN